MVPAVGFAEETSSQAGGALEYEDFSGNDNTVLTPLEDPAKARNSLSV